MRFAFLDSWVTDTAEGSGTRVAIAGLGRALESAGHEVRPVPAGFDRPTLFRRLEYNRTLGRRLESVSPDVAVGFDLDGFLLPARKPYPLVVQLKGVAADEARFERGSSRRALALLGRLEARNARRADTVVVPSRYSAEKASELYGLDREAIRIVPEFIDPAPWRALREARAHGEQVRGEAGSSPSGAERDPARPVILSVARQYPRKNTATLLEALTAVAREVPGVRLRVVGGGPELPRLRERARSLDLEDRVDLLGSLPSTAAVHEEYRRADCFCLPSLQEGFGIVFLEAMAAGLPVVGGRAGSVPEVVIHDESGILVDPTDPKALADALIRVLSDRALAERLAGRAVERAEEFTPERAVGDLLRIVEVLR